RVEVFDAFPDVVGAVPAGLVFGAVVVDSDLDVELLDEFFDFGKGLFRWAADDGGDAGVAGVFEGLLDVGGLVGGQGEDAAGEGLDAGVAELLGDLLALIRRALEGQVEVFDGAVGEVDFFDAVDGRFELHLPEGVGGDGDLQAVPGVGFVDGDGS